MQVVAGAVAASVRTVVAELSGADSSGIKDTDRLIDDLGLDSLQQMELLSRLSEDYEIDPDLDELLEIATVAEVVELLENLIKAA